MSSKHHSQPTKKEREALERMKKERRSSTMSTPARKNTKKINIWDKAR